MLVNLPVRHKKRLYVALGLTGVAYFAAFSQLHVSLPFLKIYGAGVPIQLAAFVYVVLYIRRRNRAEAKSPARRLDSTQFLKGDDVESSNFDR